MTGTRDRTGGSLFSFLFHFSCVFLVNFICCIVMGFRRVSIIALSVWRYLGFWFFFFSLSGLKRGGGQGDEGGTFHISYFRYSCLYFIFTSVVGCLYLSLYTLFTSLSLLQRLNYKCIPS